MSEMTAEEFEKIPDGKPFANGIAVNEPSGLYMTAQYIGRKLTWIAKKGQANDWCIYCGWRDQNTFEMILSNGDKVRDREHIMRLVPCSEEVFKRYRF